jgi:hypothetical protein
MPNISSCPCRPTNSNLSVLHCPPEVVCIEVPRELGVNVDHVHIALGRIPDYSLVILARRLVRLDVDAERAVQFQLQPTEC